MRTFGAQETAIKTTSMKLWMVSTDTTWNENRHKWGWTPKTELRRKLRIKGQDGRSIANDTLFMLCHVGSRCRLGNCLRLPKVLRCSYLNNCTCPCRIVTSLRWFETTRECLTIMFLCCHVTTSLWQGGCDLQRSSHPHHRSKWWPDPRIESSKTSANSHPQTCHSAHPTLKQYILKTSSETSTENNFPLFRTWSLQTTSLSRLNPTSPVWW